jgi:hypothetical protein
MLNCILVAIELFEGESRYCNKRFRSDFISALIINILGNKIVVNEGKDELRSL